jgi:hypothetical protein
MSLKESNARKCINGKDIRGNRSYKWKLSTLSVELSADIPLAI